MYGLPQIFSQMFTYDQLLHRKIIYINVDVKVSNEINTFLDKSEINVRTPMHIVQRARAHMRLHTLSITLLAFEGLLQVFCELSGDGHSEVGSGFSGSGSIDIKQRYI